MPKDICGLEVSITGVLQMNASRVPSPLAEQWSQRAREGGGQRTARKIEALTSLTRA